MDEKAKLAEMAKKLLIGEYHRHVFLCIGDACCAVDTGAKAWDALKIELKRRNLSLATGPTACYRTKVQCLRVCDSGPILVVYPEGTYYHDMTADRIPEFVDRHLLQGQPIEDWIFAHNPLPHQDG